jgi:hypothetical protein
MKRVRQYVCKGFRLLVFISVCNMGEAKSRRGRYHSHSGRDFRPILDYLFPRLIRAIGVGDTAIARALLRGLP